MGLGGESFLLGQSRHGKRKPCISGNPSSSKRGRPHSPPEAFSALGSRTARRDPPSQEARQLQDFRPEFPTAPNPHRVFPRRC